MTWSFALRLRPSVVTLALLAQGACTSKLPEVSSPKDASQTSENRSSEDPWGPNCNDTVLARDFAMTKATDFNVTQPEKSRIDEVVNEVKGGYGGTLVTAPPDAVLDSPAFLAHYLRAFAVPGDLSRYDYRFERILARLGGAESVLEDRRLDWDIWRAFLLYEKFVAGPNDANEYSTESGSNKYIQGLDSAKDLLWWYLTHNSKQIREDKERQAWWVNQLTSGMRARGGRPMRRWFLLQLVACSDTKTAALQPAANDHPDFDEFSLTTPDPLTPFLVLDGLFWEDAKPQPPFLVTIKNIADSQKLSYTIWDIDPDSMPATKAISTNLAQRLSQFAPALVLSQESWSKMPQNYAVGFSRPIGSRSSHYNVRMPFADSTDGVFFFTYNARLYVWPKRLMDSAAIQLLQISGLVEENRIERFIDQGFTRMKTTNVGER